MDLSSVATVISGAGSGIETSLTSIVAAVAAVLIPLLGGLWAVRKGFRFFGR